MLNINKYNLEYFIKFFVLLADASLIIRIGLIKPYTLQPFEFFILVATILSIIWWQRNGISDRVRNYLKRYGKIFLIAVAIFSIGIILAYIQYGMNRESVLALVKDFFFLGTIFIGFIFHVYYGNEKTFRKKALVLMSIPVLFSIFLIMPKIAEKILILGNNSSFIGWQGNTSIAGFYLLIPFSLFAFFAFTETKKRKYIYWVLAILTLSLILWTGSRGAWLAVLGILFVFLYMYTRPIVPMASKILKIFIISCCLIASASLSFLLLPHSVKVMALDRVFPQLTNFNPTPTILTKTHITFSALKNKLTKSTAIGTKPTNNEVVQQKNKQIGNGPAYQSRQILWPQAFFLLIRHPFGLGPEYGSMSKKILDPAGVWTLSHNTFLQAGLTGGFAFLVLFIFMLFYLLKRLCLIQKENKEHMLFLGLFIGFIIVISFNDYLFTIPWLWIIIGIILGKVEEAKLLNTNKTQLEKEGYDTI